MRRAFGVRCNRSSAHDGGEGDRETLGDGDGDHLWMLEGGLVGGSVVTSNSSSEVRSEVRRERLGRERDAVTETGGRGDDSISVELAELMEASETAGNLTCLGTRRGMLLYI